MQKSIIIWGACALLAIFGCKSPKALPDISSIKVSTPILRFDNDLFTTDPNDIGDTVAFLKAKYGEFLDIFALKVIKIGSPDNEQFGANLKLFVTDFNMNKVAIAVGQKYKNLQWLEDELNTAFRYYNYYYPDRRVPVFIGFISGFNQSIITTDTIMGIALDKYLGADCDFYKAMALPNYLKAGMTSDRLPVDCIRAWAMTQFEKTDSANTLLSQMLYQGKQLYFIKQLLPAKPDSLIMGYTQSQWQWCINNEEKMWTFLVENKLIFKTDYLTINKFVNEAPFTKEFTNQSPGKAAVWIGWEIVNEYMQRNPEISLPQLMANNNYQEILRLSKYRP